MRAFRRVTVTRNELPLRVSWAIRLYRTIVGKRSNVIAVAAAACAVVGFVAYLLSPPPDLPEAAYKKMDQIREQSKEHERIAREEIERSWVAEDLLYQGEWTTTESHRIPENLDDATSSLLTILRPGVLKEIRETTDSSMIDYHFSLGLTLRNQWRLWNNSRLARSLGGVDGDADDMSARILQRLWQEVQELPPERFTTSPDGARARDDRADHSE